MKIHNLLFTFFLTFLAISASNQLVIRLRKPQIRSDGYTYHLSCSNAVGDIIYNVEGLPEGAFLQGDNIFVKDSANSGNFVLRIKAIDSENSIANQIITLIINNDDAEAQIVSDAQNQVEEGEEVDTVSQRLGNIISSFSSVETLVTRPETNYEGNRFPVEKFPTGGNEDTFNPTPDSILNKNTPATDDNRNQITVNDVAIRTASERHQNAVKGITNILKLIDQARANKKQAQVDVQLYTKRHNDAIANQRKAQNAIISVENRIFQITSAIEAIEDLIESLRIKIDSLAGQKQELEQEKSSILTVVTEQETVKAGLLEQLDKTNSELSNKVKDLADQLEKCQNIESQIEEGKDQLRELKELFNEIWERRMAAQDDVDRKRRRVNDLRRQLSKAENQLADAEIVLVNLSAEAERIPRVIRSLQSQIGNLDSDLNRCNNLADDLSDQVDDIKEDETVDLTEDIDEIETQILENRKILSQIQNRLANVLGPLQDYKDQLDKAESDLIFLREQLKIVQEDLRRVYIFGNEANTKVIQAKENLDAAILRYKRQIKIVSDATLNLEKVRAEEALARLSLEQIISKYSDALPYSIVPNGNGQTDIGVPAGNNPIGSGLGPYFESRSISSTGGVNDFSSFISEQFGSGVSIRFRGQVEQLFTVAKGGRGSNIRGNECSASNEIVVSGEIIDSSYTSVDILSEKGEVYKCNLDHCTNIKSNENRHQPSVGDIIVAKGSQVSPRTLNGLEILCLHE